MGAVTALSLLLEQVWVVCLVLAISKEVPSACSREMLVLESAVRLLTWRLRRYGPLHRWLP